MEDRTGERAGRAGEKTTNSHESPLEGLGGPENGTLSRTRRMLMRRPKQT